MRTLHTPREVIATLGGVGKVAERLRVGRTSVSNWTLGDQFPAKTILAIKKALAEVDATAPDALWPMLELPSEDSESDA